MEPSESVRSFGVSRHSFASWPDPVRFRALALLPVLLLLWRRASAFQAWRNPSPQRNVQVRCGAAACRCQALAAAVAVTVAVGQRGPRSGRFRQPGPPGCPDRPWAHRVWADAGRHMGLLQIPLRLIGTARQVNL